MDFVENFTRFKDVDVLPEVKQALKNNGPVVALESTIITHGMRYPENVQTALEVEACVRKSGAIPATIAIIKGKMKVGLTKQEIEYLGKEGEKVKQCSRRDMASLLAKKGDGSTTVAATMIIAQKVGIRIFVTGGIGGVHRDVQKTWDISADLIELGTTPVAVVCAGAKSILDVSKTLEFLETHGVPVVGYKTLTFPEFFVSESKHNCSVKVDSDKECAELIFNQFNVLNFKNGLIIASPIPKENQADGKLIVEQIDQALLEAKEQNITGHQVTPFLLKRIAELTKGESLKSNIALIKNNAQVGGRIAVELSQISKKQLD